MKTRNSHMTNPEVDESESTYIRLTLKSTRPVPLPIDHALTPPPFCVADVSVFCLNTSYMIRKLKHHFATFWSG